VWLFVFAGPSLWRDFEEQAYLGLPWGLNPIGGFQGPSCEMMEIKL